jgi:hypothetical protein
MTEGHRPSSGSINGESTAEVRYRRAGQQAPSAPTSTPYDHRRVADVDDRCYSRSRAKLEPTRASSHAPAASSHTMISRTDVLSARVLPLRASQRPVKNARARCIPLQKRLSRPKWCDKAASSAVRDGLWSDLDVDGDLARRHGCSDAGCDHEADSQPL